MNTEETQRTVEGHSKNNCGPVCSRQRQGYLCQLLFNETATLAMVGTGFWDKSLQYSEQTVLKIIEPYEDSPVGV